jgi:2-oxoisovalerate dehydrogenase E1 component
MGIPFLRKYYVKDLQNKNLTKRLYKEMYKIRRFEETVAELYPTDVIQSPIHLSIGQEAVSVVVCSQLEKEDAVFASYRGHAAYIAKGGDLKGLMAELYGKETGCCKGRGGSMHLIDTSVNFMGTSAIVGSTVPIAVGYAYAQKLKGNNNITVVFLGDGAMDEGSVWESINFAVLKNIPITFVLENNFYAIHSHVKDRHGGTHFSKEISSFGMNYEFFDVSIIDNHSKVAYKLKRCREHQLPVFMEFVAYRYKEHVGPNEDTELGYRTQEELDQWKAMDQIEALKKNISKEDLTEIEKEFNLEMERVMRYAVGTGFPKARDLKDNLFKRSFWNE